MEQDQFQTNDFEDLPTALQELEACLQKSNDNVMQLRDSLSFVLDREDRLRQDYNDLEAKLQFITKMYNNSESRLKDQNNDQAELQKQQQAKIDKLIETIDYYKKCHYKQQQVIEALQQKYQNERQKREKLSQKSKNMKTAAFELNSVLDTQASEIQIEGIVDEFIKETLSSDLWKQNCKRFLKQISKLDNIDLKQQHIVRFLTQEITSIGKILPGQGQTDEEVSQLQSKLQEMTAKYLKEVKERRRLTKILQNLRGNIRVMVRARPLLNKETDSDYCLQVTDACQIRLWNSQTRREFYYDFDRVFMPTDDQDTIFYEVSDIIHEVMNGYNACILAYGQTGSGKTYTMEGSEASPGINFKAVKEIFDVIQARQDLYTYELGITILEVYNERIRNLLEPGSDKIEVRQNGITNVQPQPVQTYENVIDFINIGKSNRVVGCTNVHEYSSRSHSIVTIYVHGRTQNREFNSKLNLIDLAGSERTSKSAVQGVRLKETCNINQSLSALGKVLNALAEKSPHVPYRDSKLTHMLKDSLEGNSKTMMIITLSPSNNEYQETSSSLKFGQRVLKVERGRVKLDN